MTVKERQKHEGSGQLKNKLFKILVSRRKYIRTNVKDVIRWAPGFLIQKQGRCVDADMLANALSSKRKNPHLDLC